MGTVHALSSTRVASSLIPFWLFRGPFFLLGVHAQTQSSRWLCAACHRPSSSSARVERTHVTATATAQQVYYRYRYNISHTPSSPAYGRYTKAYVLPAAVSLLGARCSSFWTAALGYKLCSGITGGGIGRRGRAGIWTPQDRPAVSLPRVKVRKRRVRSAVMGYTRAHRVCRTTFQVDPIITMGT